MDPAAETLTTPALDTDAELARDEAFATWCDEHRDAWINDLDNNNCNNR